ncbi:DUF3558 family protein [uncultured Corynebacterium sp.]|uniref:DUF3558 family protein n=1 Tax=uncultured Corynebacterium sp. TaxID=159447 RepID=UPI0025FA2ABB|nr:DUF3558 family protein [uncultured Corynebacterium sp.]
MKRHIAWLMACGVLAGCASEPSPIDAPPAPTASDQDNEHSAEAAGGAIGGSAGDSADAPAAFHFKSGTLEIGDFDPYTLGDDIFDPCTEISPEEFAAAGFDNVEPIPEEYAGLARGLSACNFTKHSDLPGEGFGNNNASQKFVEEQTSILKQYSSDLLPDVFVYGPKNGIGTHCYAQIDTTRGGIVSEASGLDGYNSQDRTCEVAIENLDALFAANRSAKH